MKYAFLPCALLTASLATAQGPTLQLTPSDYNGYQVSCFGAKDGSIDLAVSGGLAPYTYEWSTGSTDEDITDLPAGYYRVSVTDALGNSASAEVTLNEPDAIKAFAEAFEYPNGYHISCHSCYNGSIDVTTLGGVQPMAYQWKDGTNTEDRSGLGARDYTVMIQDANGCEVEPITIDLREPERNDWTMNGNTGSVPGLHYIGTSDNKDLVLKTSGQERMRLMNSGDIKLSGFAALSSPLYLDATGSLKTGVPPAPLVPPALATPCALAGPLQYWRSDGNYFPYPLCSGEPEPVIGTRNLSPLIFIANDQQHMWLTAEGKVGIGTAPPSGQVDQYRLFVEDGIATRDVMVKSGTWPDYVFADGHEMLDLDELRAYLQVNGHLPHLPSAAEVEANDGYEVGDMQRRMLQVIEEQALYILQLKQALQDLDQRIELLETSK